MKKVKNEKEQKPRRESVKHASLNQKYNTRIRQEYIDQDYIDDLDDTVKNCRMPNGEMVTELEYLSRFMEEWNNSSVGAQSEAENNAFHRTAKDVKESTDRNNHRNGDLYGILRNKADRNNNTKLISYEAMVNTVDPTKSLENELSKDIDPRYVENAYIEFLDYKQVEAMIEEYDIAMMSFKDDVSPLESLELHQSDSLETEKS